MKDEESKDDFENYVRMDLPQTDDVSPQIDIGDKIESRENKL
eukprot:CAMPEP_0116871408 /NCGR_PEP_ID=MMETSP0463-20121206/1744_1 /TAXON_ID=181622 /ORGANISM="Strombidinopsis sp, Strain SopsisLIS2011" /LENGTH=41 /DNA_ID= /DNA_START= /DNA_END= /DNA_ORIENTATION=